MRDLRKERAMAVQLLIKCGESGFSFSEIAAVILTLQPSKDSASFLESSGAKFAQTLAELAEVTSGFSKTATGIFKISAAFSSFAAATANPGTNWFLYRFLDAERQCCAIEWNIHRRVLEECGPLLRGSLVLMFHGARAKPGGIEMVLRPRLGFDPDDPIGYLPPPGDLEGQNLVALQIEPVPALPTTEPAWT